MVRKAYGEACLAGYPDLAGKVKLLRAVARSQESGVCAWRTKRLDSPAADFTLTLEDLTLMKTPRLAILGVVTVVMLASAIAQQAAKHMLSSDELKKAVPAEYFFRGQKAPVQVRNSVGFQLANGKMTLAALVDASGYSTAIQQKYQGMLITESKLNIGGSELAPGEYGFGFTADGKFLVMDVANNDVLSAASQTDSAVAHAVPLKLVEDDGGYKLYAGKKWISLKAD
jgi:hypothetical protein